MLSISAVGLVGPQPIRRCPRLATDFGKGSTDAGSAIAFDMEVNEDRGLPKSKQLFKKQPPTWKPIDQTVTGISTTIEENSRIPWRGLLRRKLRGSTRGESRLSTWTRSDACENRRGWVRLRLLSTSGSHGHQFTECSIIDYSSTSPSPLSDGRKHGI